MKRENNSCIKMTLIGWLLLLSFAAGLQGETYFSYSTSFLGDDGSQPGAFGILNGNTDQIKINNNAYRMVKGITGFPMAKLVGNDADSWDNYTIESDIRKGYWSSTTGTWMGLMGRIQSDEYRNHYFASLVGDRIKICRNLYEGSGYGTISTLATSAQTFTYVPGQQWKMTFALEGTNLDAKLYDQSGTLVASVSTTDSYYSSGSPGLRAIPGDSTSEYADFDNFKAASTAIPTTCTEAVMTGYANPADFNHDCRVGLDDLAVMGSNWLNCVDPEDENCQQPWQ